MRLNHSLAIVLAASSVAFAAPAQAHRGPGAGYEMQDERGGMRMLRRLDLTQEQRDQVTKIFQEQRPAFQERANAARAAHEALRQATLDPNVDANRLRQLADAAGRAHAEAAVLRAETLRRVAALLTPEQRQRLEEGRGRRS